jgi:uncharacterized protein YwqG
MNPDVELLLKTLRKRVTADPNLAGLDLVSFVRPSVRLATRRVPNSRVGIGESRIGGMPDVAPGFEWPRWTPRKQRDDKFGQPWHPRKPAALGFIAQIDLSELSRVEEMLPSSGWLYFFYDRYCEPWGFDPADRGCCRVIYTAADRSSLVRMQPPFDLEPQHYAYPCLVDAWPELTLPDEFPQVEYETAAYDAYHQLRDKLTKVTRLTEHRLLGHPQPIQNAMELECQLASNGVYCGGIRGYESKKAKVLKSGATEWRLLLQIDTDEDGPGWIWGDCGRIYYWIKKQDLASLRFTDVWLIFQCS